MKLSRNLWSHCKENSPGKISAKSGLFYTDEHHNGILMQAYKLICHFLVSNSWAIVASFGVFLTFLFSLFRSFHSVANKVVAFLALRGRHSSPNILYSLVKAGTGLREVPLSLSPSRVTQRKTSTTKWPREILHVRRGHFFHRVFVCVTLTHNGPS